MNTFLSTKGHEEHLSLIREFTRRAAGNVFLESTQTVGLEYGGQARKGFILAEGVLFVVSWLTGHFECQQCLTVQRLATG